MIHIYRTIWNLSNRTNLQKKRKIESSNHTTLIKHNFSKVLVGFEQNGFTTLKMKNRKLDFGEFDFEKWTIDFGKWRTDFGKCNNYLSMCDIISKFYINKMIKSYKFPWFELANNLWFIESDKLIRDVTTESSF